MGRAFLAGLLATAAVIGGVVALVMAGGGRDEDAGRASGDRTTARTTAAARTVARTTGTTASRATRRWPRHIATDYAMFSAAGDRAVRAVAHRAARMLKAGASRARVMRSVARDFRDVERRYDEAGDTAVCEAFADELDRWLTAAGYDPVEACTEFS